MPQLHESVKMGLIDRLRSKAEISTRPDFETCSAFGDSPEEALKEV
jgi:hypothetical protein